MSSLCVGFGKEIRKELGKGMERAEPQAARVGKSEQGQLRDFGGEANAAETGVQRRRGV